jgi:sortase (surface protein transpeptidase)
VHLSIPSIGTDASVVPESLGVGDTLLIPPPGQVGWYEDGPAPGQAGTTLLAGHIDDDGVPGALLRLSDIQVGDQIRITTAMGQHYSYVVSTRAELPQSDFVSSRMMSDNGSPRLLLVSCGGAYDTTTHLYLDNILVTATQTSPAP